MASPWAMDDWDPEDWLNQSGGGLETGDLGGESTPTTIPGMAASGDVMSQGGGFITPTGGGGGDDGGGGTGLSNRPSYNFGPVPLFKAPKFTFNERFSAPSAEDVFNDPGFRFRSDEGQRALERSAAARGLARTGGTLKDLSSWAQNFASQEYGNVFDRALQSFVTNRDTAFGGYDRELAGAQAEYAPLLAQWQFLSGAERDAALAQFQREWQQYALNHQPNNGLNSWLGELEMEL